MSVKTNLLIAAAAVLGVSSAYAGGPEMMAAPAAPSFTPYFYGELGLGYAQTGYADYYSLIGQSTVGAATDVDNKNGGLSYAGDFGYEFMPHLAVELGGGYLPQAKGTVPVVGQTGSTTDIKLNSWYAYGAGRIDTNLMNDKVNVFAKAGVSYRSLSTDNISDANPAFSDLDESYWGPIFGVGASYDVRDNIYVALEYNHLGGTNDLLTVSGSSAKVGAPDVNIYMGKVGYKFNF